MLIRFSFGVSVFFASGVLEMPLDGDRGSQKPIDPPFGVSGFCGFRRVRGGFFGVSCSPPVDLLMGAFVASFCVSSEQSNGVRMIPCDGDLGS